MHIMINRILSDKNYGIWRVTYIFKLKLMYNVRSYLRILVYIFIPKYSSNGMAWITKENQVYTLECIHWIEVNNIMWSTKY